MHNYMHYFFELTYGVQRNVHSEKSVNKQFSCVKTSYSILMRTYM